MSTSTSASPSIDPAFLDRLKHHALKIATRPTPEEYIASHTIQEIAQLMNDVRAAEELLEKVGRGPVSSATREFQTVVTNLEFQLQMGKQLWKTWLDNIVELRKGVTGEIVEEE